MANQMKVKLFLGVLIVGTVSLQVSAQDDEAQQESRIDFGNTYIQGQSIKSGAVYLTNRRKSEIQSLLKQRKSYRYEIVKDYKGGEVEIVPSEKPKFDSNATSDE